MRFTLVPFVTLAITLTLAADAPEHVLPTLENGQMGYQEVVIVEGVEPQELLSRARSWIAQSYRSSNAVIQLDDAAAGSIVIKGTFTIPYMGGLNTVPIPHVLTIAAKPGRYRYTLSGFTYNDVPIEDDKALWDFIPTKNGRAKTRGRIAVLAEATVASLKAAMQVPTPAKSDW